MGLIEPNLGDIIPDMGTSFADALFTKSQQRVMAVLFGAPERSFYANEIVALAGAGVGAVHRELAKLEGAGLLTSHRVGNQRHYQANREAPIFEELRSIVSKTLGVGEILRDALQPLWTRITLAFVFGSVAKASDHAGSDVDVLILADDLSYGEVLATLDHASERLGRKVNPTVFSPTEFVKRIQEGRAFVIRVLDQPKIFVKGNPDELDSLARAAKS
ncbi:hypothetical protein LMG23992_05099 [Cupriavidus laharis]|uniref:Polymerase beta nucleotidyltransferase domain-containing protein n=1 Tax=Cupriavidus laharis TaxID=151654 RepID=A0ABM8XU47_9BURK|nr:nucleotidyltransferase domain-containing protein [Cupriavidus laharis]CAG9183888.1 hypothetical protein LMG23992_05099 [Cupriavidus laharis]